MNDDRPRRITKKAVNEQLRHWLTPAGVKWWWGRPHPMWGHPHPMGDLSTPAELWADGHKALVYDLALAGREMIAT